MKIKFLTLNVWHGGLVWDNLTRYIHEENPDIAVFQEVYNSHDESLENRFRTVDLFREKLPDLSYIAFEPNVINSKNKSPWGNAVFSKFPIKQQKEYLFNGVVREFDLVLDDPDPSDITKGMLETLINIGGKDIWVYSWHGVWGTHGGDNESRFEMEKIMVEAMKGKENIILAGDTNLNPDTQFVKNIQDKLNIESVFGTTLISTFNTRHKTKPIFAEIAVDMIFVTPNIKVVKKYQPQVDVSDHLPLVVEIEV